MRASHPLGGSIRTASKVLREPPFGGLFSKAAALHIMRRLRRRVMRAAGGAAEPWRPCLFLVANPWWRPCPRARACCRLRGGGANLAAFLRPSPPICCGRGLCPSHYLGGLRWVRSMGIPAHVRVSWPRCRVTPYRQIQTVLPLPARHAGGHKFKSCIAQSPLIQPEPLFWIVRTGEGRFLCHQTPFRGRFQAMTPCYAGNVSLGS